VLLHRSEKGVITWTTPFIYLRARPDLMAAKKVGLGELEKLDGAILEAFGLTALVDAHARAKVANGYMMRMTDAGDRPSVQRTWSFGRGDPRAVWIRGRTVKATAGGTDFEAAFDAFDGFPAALNDALGTEVGAAVRAAVDALKPLPCFCHTGVQSLEEHDALETIVVKFDPRAPVDSNAAVARCRVCEQGWTFEWSGDSHYGFTYSATPFIAQVGYSPEELDRLVNAFSRGWTPEVTIGVSRCHTTYRGKDGQAYAEDFDEGMTEEKPISERTLRYVVASDPDAFLPAIRIDAQVDFEQALREDAADLREKLGELLRYGDFTASPELLWPDAELPPGFPGMERTGNDVYHAVLSTNRYQKNGAAGRFGIQVCRRLAEKGHDKMPEFRLYRAEFHLLVDDWASALEDLKWEQSQRKEPDSSIQQKIDMCEMALLPPR
jgi:hypothetical protein